MNLASIVISQEEYLENDEADRDIDLDMVGILGRASEFAIDRRAFEDEGVVLLAIGLVGDGNVTPSERLCEMTLYKCNNINQKDATSSIVGNNERELLRPL